MNPRAPNEAGHILEIAEDGADAAATAFRWEIFLLAGDPAAGRLVDALPAGHDSSLAAAVTYFGGASDAAEFSAFANPDNLAFDAAGNLWIVTDGVQPERHQQRLLRLRRPRGPRAAAAKQFMSGPVGAEICGCEITSRRPDLVPQRAAPGDRRQRDGSREPLARRRRGGAAAEHRRDRNGRRPVPRPGA